MNTKKIIILAFAFLLLGAYVGIAQADLNAVSPTKARGFPLWYRDLPSANGASSTLKLCLDPTFCDVTAPLPGNALSQRVGFGRKAFYWRAETRITRGNLPMAEVHLGVEAAYQGNVVANGKQITNNFIIIELKNLPVDGNYTVIHPFGRNVFRVVAEPGSGRREVNFVSRVGGRNFSLALNGPVGPVLTGVDPPSPAGFIGFHNVLQTVTGSPRGTNFIRVIGPPNANLGGTPPKRNVVTQTQFFISGQLF